jgi:hypothetical protein
MPRFKQFVLRIPPLGEKAWDKEADELFCQEIEAILLERRAMGGAFSGTETSGEQIIH